MKICVVTSYAAAAEPRAPRHAVAAKAAFPHADVIFVDLAAAGRPRIPDPPELSAHGIQRCTIEFPTRLTDPLRLTVRKARTRLNRFTFSMWGKYDESVFGDRAQGLTSALKTIPADVYIAHNIETLIPAVRAARTHNAAIVFDCMEYYSDMGDGQHRTEILAARQVETRYLPHCALVIASSDRMADALSSEYGIARPLPSYNTPPRLIDLPERLGNGLNLYWRNSAIGFGQRGLEDIIEALAMLPGDVKLFLQGRPASDGGSALYKRLNLSGVGERVTVLPPYMPTEAVQQASRYDVGLCLERKGPRNHDLTVSNKMFDYHMAGLAVIASNLPSLADVISQSGAGLLYEPGNPKALAASIRHLRSCPQLLEEMQHRARRFALDRANQEFEIEKIAKAFQRAFGAPTIEEN